MHAACSQVCTKDFLSKLGMGVLLFHAHHRYIIHHPATRPTSTRSELVQVIIEEQWRNICSTPPYVLSEMNKIERGRPRRIRLSASSSFVSNQMLSKLETSLKSFMLHRTLHSLECLRLDLQFVLHIDPHRTQSHPTCSFRPNITRFASSGTLPGPIIP